MSQRWFTNLCLAVVIVIITVIAIKQTLAPTHVSAAAKEQYLFEYCITVGSNGSSMAPEALSGYLNKKAAEGWQLHSIVKDGCFWKK
jgi:hypothetical protein